VHLDGNEWRLDSERRARVNDGQRHATSLSIRLASGLAEDTELRQYFGCFAYFHSQVSSAPCIAGFP
jgi:hypothetical protein